MGFIFFFSKKRYGKNNRKTRENKKYYPHKEPFKFPNLSVRSISVQKKTKIIIVQTIANKQIISHNFWHIYSIVEQF